MVGAPCDFRIKMNITSDVYCEDKLQIGMINDANVIRVGN